MSLLDNWSEDYIQNQLVAALKNIKAFESFSETKMKVKGFYRMHIRSWNKLKKMLHARVTLI